MEGETEDRMEIVIFPERTRVKVNGKFIGCQLNYNDIQVTFVDVLNNSKSTTLGTLVQAVQV